MRIGILQAGHAPESILDKTGDFDAMFRVLLAGQDLNFVTFNVVDGEFPDDAQTCEGWLITGSRHGAYEDHPWIPPLEALIRAIYADGRPLVGICFGHQIIAQALGGRVAKFDGGWAVGRQTYQFDGQDIALNAWHQDQVVERPEGAQVLAGNEFCENAALIYDNRILTIQPHPEFGATAIEGLLGRYRDVGLIPEEQLQLAAANMDAPVESAAIAGRITAFLKREKA